MCVLLWCFVLCLVKTCFLHCNCQYTSCTLNFDDQLYQYCWRPVNAKTGKLYWYNSKQIYNYSIKCCMQYVTHIFTLIWCNQAEWARWRLKSPASRLFTQPFIQVQIKENIKAPHHRPLDGNLSVTGEFAAQMASNAENVFIWWRHHESCACI